MCGVGRGGSDVCAHIRQNGCCMLMDGLYIVVLTNYVCEWESTWIEYFVHVWLSSGYMIGVIYMPMVCEDWTVQ